MHTYIHCSTIHSGQDMETTGDQSFGEKNNWKPQDVVHIYNEICSAIRKDEILPLVTTQVDLENIILSEISQVEKIKNRMTSLICKL